MSSKDQKADAAFDDGTMRLGWGLRELDRMCSSHWSGEVDLVRVKVRLGDTAGDETLVVLEGVDGEGTPVVGFHSQSPPSEAVAAALRRAASGQMRWKVDEFKTKPGA